MAVIKNQTFDAERAFYGQTGAELVDCTFEGPADGESAFKECKNVSVSGCYFALRYPFWHDDGVTIENCELTEKCRAALWYSKNITIKNSKLHGIKALRECEDTHVEDTDILSPEFGWSAKRVTMERCTAQSEYFMLRAEQLHFKNVEFTGKYSFQYVQDSVFENCVFRTKDAFWHGKNILVKNCVVQGEYLAWYAEDITFENCKIIGTQPLCYCKGLRLIDCEMVDTDLSFEKSEVYATLTTPIVSIKNPKNGVIRVPGVGEIIRDDENSHGVIEILK